jgi:hypothetical protein
MRRAHGQPVAVSSRATRCALVAFVSLAIFAGVAAAASACAQDVIDDWADNGIVDGTYAPKCYENAIAELPEDLRSYSSAADDINRALQQALLREAPPSTQDSGSSAPSVEESDAGGEAPAEEPDTDEGEEEEKAAASPAETEPPPPDDPSVASDDAVASAAGVQLGEGGDTLPLPVILLLVLVGVAIVSAVAILGLRGLKERRAGRE